MAHQSCSVNHEDASQPRQNPKEYGKFPVKKIHRLAEEAAKLEAEIVQETYILNKEKQSLEEHLAHLMGALEAHVESQSRASTPEDIQQLQV